MRLRAGGQHAMGAVVPSLIRLKFDRLDSIRTMLDALSSCSALRASATRIGGNVDVSLCWGLFRKNAVYRVGSCIHTFSDAASCMARPLRPEFAGGFYYVTSRGDRREDIFFDDADRLAWLALFDQVCQRFNWVCHVWCLMDNHYHVVVEVIEGNLAQGMRHLNGVYTQASSVESLGEF